MKKYLNKIGSIVITSSLVLLMMIGFSVNVRADGIYDYTLLIYLNGSDLESDEYAATDDLLELIYGDIPDNVAVIVETGGTKDWHTDEYGLARIDSRSSQRWQITDNEMILLESGPLENMGEAETLESFLVYGTTYYPADDYGVILWNHGSGSVYGYGADENFQYDGLTIEEMDEAFGDTYENTGKRFDFVGFDACLMGSVEVAEMLMPYADYLIGSEELEPGHGWDYSVIANAISQKR